MLRFLCLTLLVLSLTACQHRESMYECRETVYYDTEELSAIVWDFLVQVAHENGLFPENAQVISGPSETKLRFDFSSQDIIEMCPARDLLVDIVENILERINMAGFGSKIQPYPFTADQLEIYIDFQSYYGVYCDPTYIGWIVLENGMSFFYTFLVKDKDPRTPDLWQVRREPYFKSRSFVYLQRASEARYEKTHEATKYDFHKNRMAPFTPPTREHQF